MYLMQISRHNAESCPAYNEHNKKSTVALLQKFEALIAKHGIKSAGMWNDHPGHTVYNIYETPSLEAFMALSMEPEWLAWLAYNTVELKVVFGPQEIKTMFNLK
jgi:hypothetical protein